MIIKRDFGYGPEGENRPLHIYLPENYGRTDERYPVTYFFDGHNLFYDSDATYGKCWGLKTFLDQWSKDMIVVGLEVLSRVTWYTPVQGHGIQLTALQWNDE